MTPPTSPTDVARAILAGFDLHYGNFRATSTAAKGRWERADGVAIREAARARIDWYDERVRDAVAVVREHFPEAAPLEGPAGPEAQPEALWHAIKIAYVGLLYEHKQPECAETFFNSVACRVLDRRYYDNSTIFVRPAISTEHLDGDDPTYRCYYPREQGLAATFRQALADFDLALPWVDLDADAARIAASLDAALGLDASVGPGAAPRPNFQVHVLRSLLFRNDAAYVVGRAENGGTLAPFVIPLLRVPAGRDGAGQVYADAMLTDAGNVGRVFSLGRVYFFVDMEVPSAWVAFLQTIVPSKSRAELYTMVGLQKQGKTLFYRDMQQHLRHSTDRFVLARGTKGMVMVVFTLPSFPYVFKVIRDWFQPPKEVDRRRVEERYRYVKLHDRVGRMADTLEYSHVAFPLARFDPAVIEELRALAPSSVAIEGDNVVVRHLYIERRLTPVDVLLGESEPAQARAVIDEFGHAIKELAAANFFPGDLLPKNFGATRHGRVVFYDYDELTEVTACRFRRIPRPRTDEDELAAEPYFHVEPDDVFPEQFPTFLFPDGPARATFLELHGDLADAGYWIRQQRRIREHGVEDVRPYPESARFPREG